jgi:hypothetical protein
MRLIREILSPLSLEFISVWKIKSGIFCASKEGGAARRRRKFSTLAESEK